MKFVQPTDTGYYECRAMNVVAREPAIGRTRVIVSPTPTVWNATSKNGLDRGMTSASSTPNASTAWHAKGRPCPIATFCLNGGTCSFHENVGEHVCLWVNNDIIAKKQWEHTDGYSIRRGITIVLTRFMRLTNYWCRHLSSKPRCEPSLALAKIIRKGYSTNLLGRGLKRLSILTRK